MVPALSGMTPAGNPVRRFGFVYIPMGMNPAPWIPKAEGKITELSTSLASLMPVMDQTTVITNTELKMANSAGNHATANSSFLTATLAKRTEGNDYVLSTSIDHDRKTNRKGHADPVARTRNRSHCHGRQLR